MITLAINTSSFTESVALMTEKKILKEISWKGHYDETEKLLRNIQKLLKTAKVSFKKIGGIIVMQGPGPFSATRIGVTVANTLAFCLNAPLIGINTLDFWQLRYRLSNNNTKEALKNDVMRGNEESPPEPYCLVRRQGDDEVDEAGRVFQRFPNAICMLHAGGDFVSMGLPKTKTKLLRITEALNKVSKMQRLVFFGDITENEMREFKKAKKPGWKFIPESQLKSFGETILNMRKLKTVKTVSPVYWQPPKITKPKKSKVKI